MNTYIPIIYLTFDQKELINVKQTSKTLNLEFMIVWGWVGVILKTTIPNVDFTLHIFKFNGF